MADDSKMMLYFGCLALLILVMGGANLASTLVRCESFDAPAPAPVAAAGMSSSASTDAVFEPPLPGIMPGKEKAKLLLAQDIDWPPYAFISEPPESDFTVAGFGNDFAKGMAPGCGIDVVTMQTDWGKCWDSGKLGIGLENGYYHGCMTYTHTVGERNRFGEFSHAILDANKPAGLITRLIDGQPKIDGNNNLTGLKIVDVTGWAPTSDTLAVVTNQCTGGKFVDFEMIMPAANGTMSPNDIAMNYLMNDDADAIWIYADQAYNYQCGSGVTPEWDCSKWSGLGTTYAYIHVGMLGHVYNGTTLTLSKKGSGLRDIVNPCIDKFLETKDYYDLCVKHHLEGSCFRNSFFPGSVSAKKTWELKTSELTTSCADGYCPCPAR